MFTPIRRTRSDARTAVSANWIHFDARRVIVVDGSPYSSTLFFFITICSLSLMKWLLSCQVFLALFLTPIFNVLRKKNQRLFKLIIAWRQGFKLVFTLSELVLDANPSNFYNINALHIKQCKFGKIISSIYIYTIQLFIYLRWVLNSI